MKSGEHCVYVALIAVIGLNSFSLWFTSLPPLEFELHRRTIPQQALDVSYVGVTERFGRKSTFRNNGLPEWMVSYLEWHAETRRQLNETNWRDHRYLISRCYFHDAHCGGLVDRLRGLPFLVQVAAMTGRLLLFHWERPYDLTEFLEPTAVNWTKPAFVQVPRYSFAFTRVKDVPYIEKSSEAVVSIRLQAYKEAEKYFDRYKVHRTDANTTSVLPALWKLFFRPSSPVRQQIESIYRHSDILPSNYLAIHLRLLYAVNATSGAGALVESVRNALACISRFPGFSSVLPFVVTSDSQEAVRIAKRLAPTQVIAHSTSMANKYPGPTLHLDRGVQFFGRHKSSGASTTYPVDAYYATFVDFYLLVGAKCVAYDRGGFGRLASLLSENPTCFSNHRHHQC